MNSTRHLEKKRKKKIQGKKSEEQFLNKKYI
jgi:hypothetical protein